MPPLTEASSGRAGIGNACVDLCTSTKMADHGGSTTPHNVTKARHIAGPCRGGVRPHAYLSVVLACRRDLDAGQACRHPRSLHGRATPRRREAVTVQGVRQPEGLPAIGQPDGGGVRWVVSDDAWAEGEDNESHPTCAQKHCGLRSDSGPVTTSVGPRSKIVQEGGSSGNLEPVRGGSNATGGQGTSIHTRAHSSVPGFV